MRESKKTWLGWVRSLNAVDEPGENSLHRFLLSARLGLWPAITLSSVAFGYLLEYMPIATGLLSLNLCLVASVAFLFNDIRDAPIDAVNEIHRWSLRSPFDRRLFMGTCAGAAAVMLASFFWLSGVAAIGVAVSMLVGIAYSLVCKRIFLLGNVVAAGLSISPGLIMSIDVLLGPDNHTVAIGSAVAFLMIAFLILLSREIKFDEFDLPGDRMGNRSTLPMRLHRTALDAVHGILAATSLCLFVATVALNGRFSWESNFFIAISISLAASTLLITAYRSPSKETFYKKTRLVMLMLPLSMLLSF